MLLSKKILQRRIHAALEERSLTLMEEASALEQENIIPPAAP